MGKRNLFASADLVPATNVNARECDSNNVCVRCGCGRVPFARSLAAVSRIRPFSSSCKKRRRVRQQLVGVPKNAACWLSPPQNLYQFRQFLQFSYPVEVTAILSQVMRRTVFPTPPFLSSRVTEPRQNGDRACAKIIVYIYRSCEIIIFLL